MAGQHFGKWMTGDKRFLEMIYPKMEKLMRFCGKQINEQGFIYGREKDWVFIDCYESGKQHVTRHANLFAILFDLVDEKQTEQILKNVVMNPDVPRITTPYFEFFELDVLGKTGHLEQVSTINHGNIEKLMKESEQAYYQTCIHIEVQFVPEEAGLMEEYFPDCPVEAVSEETSRLFIDVPAKERLWKALLLSFGNSSKFFI